MHRVDHYSWHVIKFTIKAFDFVRFVHVPDCNDYRIKVKIKVLPYQQLYNLVRVPIDVVDSIYYMITSVPNFYL